MMNLIIDVGNTLVKLAVFKNNTLIFKTNSVKDKFLPVFFETSKKYPDIKIVIISAVAELSNKNIVEIKKRFKTFILSHEDLFPFKNNYTSPKTLGIDRIALVSSAAIKFPKKNVLIIDAGTCITYDFKNSDNEYMGGAISPGLKMRYKALNLFTDKLPLLEPLNIKTFVGESTEKSMHVGVYKGVIAEIEGFISMYHKEYKELTIILTGGDANYLLDSLKNDIFATSNFLLEGLNYILEHNKDKC